MLSGKTVGQGFESLRVHHFEIYGLVLVLTTFEYGNAERSIANNWQKQRFLCKLWPGRTDQRTKGYGRLRLIGGL